jgi:hypothetical protein
MMLAISIEGDTLSRWCQLLATTSAHKQEDGVNPTNDKLTIIVQILWHTPVKVTGPSRYGYSVLNNCDVDVASSRFVYIPLSQRWRRNPVIGLANQELYTEEAVSVWENYWYALVTT